MLGLAPRIHLHCRSVMARQNPRMDPRHKAEGDGFCSLPCHTPDVMAGLDPAIHAYCRKYGGSSRKAAAIA